MLRSDTHRNKIYLVSFNLTVVLSSNRAEVDACRATGKTDRHSEVQLGDWGVAF